MHELSQAPPVDLAFWHGLGYGLVLVTPFWVAVVTALWRFTTCSGWVPRTTPPNPPGATTGTSPEREPGGEAVPCRPEM
jgi:hypothetical protein